MAGNPRIARGPLVHQVAIAVAIAALLMTSAGCWAPLHAVGVRACDLPDSFRTPYRTSGFPLNYSNLTLQPPANYILGSNDILEVTVPGLFDGSEVTPLRARIMASGAIPLPLVGAVQVGNMDLLQAQRAIAAAYANGILVAPKVSISLAEKATTNVLVLGKVNAPGIVTLSKYENDVGHALAAGGGFAEDSPRMRSM